MVHTSNNHRSNVQVYFNFHKKNDFLLFVKCLNKHQHADCSSVVEPKPVPQEQNLFALAEPEPECITVRVPEL
jgi:hypothetical protein